MCVSAGEGERRKQGRSIPTSGVKTKKSEEEQGERDALDYKPRTHSEVT